MQLKDNFILAEANQKLELKKMIDYYKLTMKQKLFINSTTETIFYV